MPKLLLTIILIITFWGCSSLFGVPVKEGMATWIGASKHQLITVWGPPAKIDSDGNNGEVLTYFWVFQENKGKAEAISYGQYTHIRYSTPKTKISEANVYVDKSGKIYHWRTNFSRLWKSNVNPYKRN